MRIALINTSKKSKLYPLALMKISTMLKSKGHKTKLFTNELPKKINMMKCGLQLCLLLKYNMLCQYV